MVKHVFAFARLSFIWPEWKNKLLLICVEKFCIYLRFQRKRSVKRENPGSNQ